MVQFCHLHVHSDYSELDGLGKISDYVKKAIALKQPAIAITDHGQTSGAYELYKECKDKPIKAILGTEFYIHTDLGVGHLVALAINNEGWKNILKLQAYAYSSKGFRNRKPCIDMQSLKKYNEGIIITSACAANPIGYSIKAGELSDAMKYAKEFQNIFGSRFYMEIQSSDTPEQILVNQGVVNIAQKIGAELVLTNDCHYVDAEDAETHEVLLAIQTKKKMSDENRFKFNDNGYYLKNYNEMVAPLKLPKSIYDRALSNTLVIAEQCNATIEIGDYRTQFDHSGHKSSEAMLRHLTTEGYKRVILADGKDTPKYRSDIAHELDIICGERYDDYYLVVQDYINHARRNGMPVGDGRGSGAGSKVAYVTGITAIDPEPYNLLFERFLAKGRIPDIDVDFADRDFVIQYLMKKYGKNNVATVGAFGTLSIVSASRKVMSAFGHPFSTANNICKQLDSSWTVEEAKKNCSDFATFAKQNPVEIKHISKLINVIANYSTHAGGVLIYKGLTELIPVRTKGEDRDKLIACLDKVVLEELGHIKYDILGLENLTVVKDTLDAIKAETGTRPDMRKIDLDDKTVFESLSKGDVSGVFQLSNQSHMLVEQKPTTFEDLIAINALIRPGVADFNEYLKRRRGGEWKIHELRKSYMDETFGLYTYQEQYMLDCQTFAGWSIAFADKHVRKNKNIKEDTNLHAKFISDGMTLGFEEALLERIWDDIVFAVGGGYGFCKAHATSYAKLSYDTAWLKTHHTSHFYASLMTSKGDDAVGLAQLFQEANSLGLTIAPPDINVSTGKFVARGNTIYYRITSIAQVGQSAINAILDRRPFKSLEDFVSRTTRSEVRSDMLINLIKAGAFDFQDTNRVELINKAYELLGIKDRNKDVKYTDKVKWAYEKESLGLYLSSHPLDRFHYRPFTERNDGETVTTAGEVSKLEIKKDKKGKDMAFITLDTKYGPVRCLIFSSNWSEKVNNFIKSNEFIEITGTKSGESLLVNKLSKV